jgi:hypothetical protein
LKEPPVEALRLLVRLAARLVVGAVAIVCMVAAADAAAAERPTGLQAFINTYRCAVIERLQLIHLNRAHETDRFLVLALRRNQEMYVQCLFMDDDRQMLCEASSGFYAQLPGEPRRFRVTPQGLGALARLGFSTDDSRGNYQRLIGLSSTADFPLVADLILSALYQAYGARIGSDMEWKSPLAGVDPATSPCTPIG